MKSNHLVPMLCLFLPAFSPGILASAEVVEIQPVLHLFRTAALPHIQLTKGLPGDTLSGRVMVFGHPATVMFEGERLVIDGADYTWNGGSKVPSQMQVTKLPTIVTALGQVATIRAEVPLQYLEKIADGSLQVRDIPRDSPDMPRYQLTLEVRPPTGTTAGADLVVSCQMDVTTVQGREKIPGVELEVGRPILARFNERVEFRSKRGEWTGILTGGTKDSGDYTLLLMIKVSPADPAAAARAVRPAKAATPLQPAEYKLAAGLAVSANGVTDLWLGLDRRSRAAWPPTRSNPGVRFGLKLRGSGPVYRKFEVSRHGAETSSVPHEGTVTIDAKHQWVVIDLQEVVSKSGEPRRTEPCEANGRYPVEAVITGAGANSPLDQTGMTPGSGPTASELAVPAVPNGPYVQPR